MIVTADTNIYISALYFGGRPLEFLRRAIDREFELVISPPILDEVLRVLRDKFGSDARHLLSTRELILDCARLCETSSTLAVVSEDPADDRVLECAIDSGSRVIISGDGDLLRLRRYQNIRIITVAQFLDESR